MQRLILSLAALACLPVLFTAAPAYAAPATFVSQTGNNADNCTSPATPCASISSALTKTTEGGVIHVLPGEYSTFLVDKAVEIIVDGGQASITNSATAIPGGGGAAEIVVNAGPEDEVRIRGFILDGGVVAASFDSHGVAFIAGGALHVEDCTLVRGGDSFGVAFRPTGASELYISNCAISGNGGASGGGGVQVRPSGSGSAKAVLDNVHVKNNQGGILIDGTATSGTNTVTIRNSTVGGNSSFGIFAIDSGGGSTNVTVEGSSSANNVTFGIAANGASVTERVRNSTITGNGTGLVATNTSKLISNGGNLVAGNTVNGAFTQTVGQQ